MNHVERQVQRALFIAGRSAYTLMMPNYTPDDWWECDLFAVTKAGYFHEHEIKVSIEDFRADSRKVDRGYKRPRVTKHQRLKEAYPKGPSRFFYVTPAGLLRTPEIPRWAGLKTFEWYEQYQCYMLKTEKKAPQIHREYVAEGVIEHARGVGYYRFWEERKKLDEARAKIRRLRGKAANSC